MAMASSMQPAATYLLATMTVGCFLVGLSSASIHDEDSMAQDGSDSSKSINLTMTSGMLLSLYLSNLKSKNLDAPSNLETTYDPKQEIEDQENSWEGPAGVASGGPKLADWQAGSLESAIPSTGSFAYQCCATLALHSTGSLSHSVQRPVMGMYHYTSMTPDHLPIYHHNSAAFVLFYNANTKHWQVSQQVYQPTAFLIAYGSVWCPEHNTSGWSWYNPRNGKWVLDTTARFHCIGSEKTPIIYY